MLETWKCLEDRYWTWMIWCIQVLRLAMGMMLHSLNVGKIHKCRSQNLWVVKLHSFKIALRFMSEVSRSDWIQKWLYLILSMIDDVQEFWSWCWDDLVSKDLPTMLQFVHSSTQQPVYYVGYSQVSTHFLHL